MTSAPINEYSAVLAYRSGISTDNGNSNPTDDLFGSFQNAMNQAKNSQTDTVKETTGKTQTVGSITRTTEAFGVKTEASASRKTDASSGTGQKAGADQTEKVKDTVEHAVKDAEKKVVKEVADELDVTEEEVVEAMEALGLTVMDLMDQTNMAALVTQLLGENDPMALLTDENLFMTIQQLTVAVGDIIDESVQNLSEELAMDMDQVFSMMETSTETTEGVISGAETDVVIEVENDLAAEEVKIQADDVSESPEETGEESITAQAAEKALDDKQAAGQNQSMMNADHESSPLINQMFNLNTVTAEDVQSAELPFTSYVDTNDIINQIGEYVKIHNSEGLSEMEISLNPESLGNIHLQVASREGVITATITAQNDAVRDALMVQAMTLKEELNEQGLKVEAVDVTVASHEFERDMHGGGEEAQNLFEQQVQKQTRRRIVIENLMQAEEMLSDDDLTDAERIQIDMMAKSGNSVDFTA